MNTNNELAKLTQELSVPEAIVETLMARMSQFFDDAEAQKAVIEGIIVTQPDQVAEMQQARDIRLQIAKRRFVARDIVKEEREKLKNAMADFKLQDTLWLKSFQMLEAVCDNLESKCLEKEKFAERYEAEQKQLRYEARVAKLYQFGTDPSIYALADMDDESFEKLLANEKLAYNARIAAQKQAEADAALEAKAEADRLEAIRKENIELRAQAEIKEKELAKERAAGQKILDAERKAREAIEAKIRTDKEKRDREERELQINEDAQRKSKEDEDRKKLLAPDRDKLIDLAATIDKMFMPAVKTDEAATVVRESLRVLRELSNYIRLEAKKLS